MLPSKGYFKSLNCPYFGNGFCDRPHCHFRHTRKDKASDDIQQQDDVDESTQHNIISDVGTSESSSNGSWPVSQQSSGTSTCYKPTPIVELRRRHIPITIAPSVTLSATSQKRRIEYGVRGVKRPKVEYIPETVASESNLNIANKRNVTSSVYKATKISDHPDRFSNGVTAEKTAHLQDTEESEGEIDFDQVSNELNFLDEILKEYEKPVSISKLLKNIPHSNEVDFLEKKEQEQISSELLSDNVCNGLRRCQVPLEKNKKPSSESDNNHSSGSKKPEDSDEKVKSSHSHSKHKTAGSNTDTERIRHKSCNSSSTPCNKPENKNISEHRRKSLDHHKSDRDKNKNKDGSETLQSSSKLTEKESENESAFDKLLKSDSHKSTNSSKHSKREHGSSSNKSSKKESEPKSSSHKSKRKDSERESSCNKSSANKADRKNSSSKSSKNESDHHSRSSKSSKSRHKESDTKRTHSPENQSSSKKHKGDSKADKQGDSKKSSKPKDENKHRKETHEKRHTKEDPMKDHKKREKTLKENAVRRNHTHSVSESDHSSDNDVEIISETGSIIVIDSEEDTDSENSPPKKKSRMENIERSLSPASVPSPTFPSDISDSSDVENNVRDHIDVQSSLVSCGSSLHKKTQDDALLLDHRVQSRVKSRVSLGSTRRPPTKKPVEFMTPAQRMLLFAKQLREQEEKDSEAQANAGRVKIGCVPNVKLLLEEKERLLKGSKKSIKPFERKSISVPPKKVMDSQSQVEDKDMPPVGPLSSKHPRRKGADHFTRLAMLQKLYKYQKQLLEPHRLFKDARNKCLEDESKVWMETNHDTYEREMQNLILRRRAEIPDFTLRYFTSIRPKTSTMFPPELKKKPENGIDLPSTHPSSEESLYSWMLKYQLSEEQLVAEGYPRKKEESSSNTFLAYISPESLAKWQKARGVPPTGEYVCSNCSKFYAVDENGLSTRIGECQYHSKKAVWSSKDKSGLLEKKARCCGNDVQNPCMSSKYHSTETRDLQNLKGFVETKPPKGEMPVEGWGIFALDCEMYWSTRGVELGRVTVVNAEQRTVYDTFVKPEFLVTDYSTRMSGLTEENLQSAKKTLTEVQNDLLKIFNSKTILIGHSLENDLKVLQIVHSTVVDTAMVFKNGEYKQALKTLATNLLKEVIQNEEDGHDSAEDAVTCIKLMIQKITKDAMALVRRAPPAPRGRYRASNPLGI